MNNNIGEIHLHLSINCHFLPQGKKRLMALKTRTTEHQIL